MQKSYRTPLLIAVILHLAIIVFLSVNVAVKKFQWPQEAAQPAVVNATAIDSKLLNQQINQVKLEQSQQERKKNDQLRRIKEQTEAIEQQRLAESQRLKQMRVEQENLKKQQAAQAEALKQQQEAALQAQQKALAYQKKLADLKKQEAVKQQELLKKQEAVKQQELLKKQEALKQQDLLKKQALAKQQELLKKQENLQQQLLDQQLRAEQQQINNNKQKLEKENLAQMEGILDKYRAQILRAIQSNWHPPVQDDKLYCQMLVHLAPGGVVLSVDVVKSSGDPALDRTAELAILKSSPLPVPQDEALFDRFREFRIKMTPQDIKGLS